MFSGFNLKIDNAFFKEYFDAYKENGENHLRCSSKEIKKKLKQFVNKKTIDGSKLQNAWFPEIEADIFISHSHKDRELANALAGWINSNFGLKVFIDSNIWGNINTLLEEINSKYSGKHRDPSSGIFTYDHDACTEASKHVNMMLSIALQQMIDKVECIIFLNTDNSVTVYDGERMDTTYSPWIYSEIVCSQIIRKKPLWNYRSYRNISLISESAHPVGMMYSLMVTYDVFLDHLVEIDGKRLDEWLEKYERRKVHGDKEYPLDDLYEFTHPKDLSKTRDIFESFGSEKVDEMKQKVMKKEITFEQLVFNDNYKCCEIFRDCNRCHFKGFKCPIINERGNDIDE